MNMPKPFIKNKGRDLLKGSSSSIANEKGKKSCLNIEELLQFHAARMRALNQTEPVALEASFSDFFRHRIFVNYMDNFIGSHLVKYLIGQSQLFEKEEKDDNRKSYESTEGEEEENEGEREVKEKSQNNVPYEIVGTLDFANNMQYSRPDGVLELLDQDKKVEFLEKVLTCGFIVYDITTDLSCHPTQINEARWVAENIYERLRKIEKSKPTTLKYQDCRTFILISPLMTWAKTKPVDPEDLSLPLTEKDFRKRKPHPNYKAHCELEKRIIELGKKFPEQFRTMVVGTGIPYGHEEDVLHFYFKMAWENEPFLPVFKPGTNILPIIHVDSLSSVIHSIIMKFPPKIKYIIAMDPHTVTLKKIAKLLAKELGTGKTELVNKEEAFLFPEVKQRNYDMLTFNLNIIPGFILDNPNLRWATDRPFQENITKLIAEFKSARGLLPIKIFVHGPPGSGKSFLATRLSLYYDIPRLDVGEVVQEALTKLNEKIEDLKNKSVNTEEKDKLESMDLEEEYSNESDDDEEETENLEELQNFLKELEDNMNNENHKLDEVYIVRLVKEKLLSNLCRNKGFVIDGYPKTMEHTKMLYAPDPDFHEEIEGEDDEVSPETDVSRFCNTKIMPAHVVSLDASDEYLINRMIKTPEICSSHFEEKQMCGRLTEFRALNTDENTPLIFYDELEVHPMIYNMENDADPNMEPTFQAVIHQIGPPKNYGPGKKFADILKAEETASKQQNFEELKAQREEVKRATQERRDNLEKWMFLKNQEMEMEEKALLVMGMPLRHYLMKYIFPTLTRGLVEVARLRPDDPVDFLSEFLFRENPEGKMFQPNYDEREERLVRAFKEYEESLMSKPSESVKSSKTFSKEKSAQSRAVSGLTDYKCDLVSRSTPSSKSGRSIKSGKGHKGSSKSDMRTSSAESISGICTCKRTPPSLDTCSSDITPSSIGSGVSCTCPSPEPCEPCEPCDDDDADVGGGTTDEENCACPCVT